MDYYITQLQTNISTVNVFDTTCQKISDYKRNKNIDDDAFNDIIHTINELNYDLLYDHEFKLFLEFYKDMYNSSYDEKIDNLTYYFYHTDLSDSFIQAYGVRLAEKMHKDHKYFIKYYNVRYLNHLIQHINNMLQLDIVHLDEQYNYIFNHDYDLFPDVITFERFNEYEYEYCNEKNINYSDYVIDYCANTLIRFKK